MPPARPAWFIIGRHPPLVDPALPIGQSLVVDLPANLAMERQPNVAMQAIIGELSSPRRWQKRRGRIARSVRCEGSRNPALSIEAERDLAYSLACSGADQDRLGIDHTPAQCAIVKNGVRGPGDFGQIAHQFAAHERGRMLGAHDRDDAQRQNVEPPIAVDQCVAPRDEAKGTRPCSPVEFASSGRDCLGCSEFHPGLGSDVALHSTRLGEPNLRSFFLWFHTEALCQIEDGRRYWCPSSEHLAHLAA